MLLKSYPRKRFDFDEVNDNCSVKNNGDEEMITTPHVNLEEVQYAGTLEHSHTHTHTQN